MCSWAIERRRTQGCRRSPSGCRAKTSCPPQSPWSPSRAATCLHMSQADISLSANIGCAVVLMPVRRSAQKVKVVTKRDLWSRRYIVMTFWYTLPEGAEALP